LHDAGPKQLVPPLKEPVFFSHISPVVVSLMVPSPLSMKRGVACAVPTHRSAAQRALIVKLVFLMKAPSFALNGVLA
jgi:hypothetical protein